MIELLELVKNIGLGLFVNGSYGLLNGELSLANAYITISSVAIMAGAFHLQRRFKR
ncbi:hypothetical protein [Campylobacter sp. 19-13652]|uniref:hypothetical protein n=1 Tax=Campylobacter sp. 19-13652 TaxID=2840180 RepID=UPI001C780945|nr:hypothetical protein [Campylobacter sp. 19-13652]BCX79959.1 hypothetical protein LBC_14210 [Campylobacter sp. 19-13652]